MRKKMPKKTPANTRRLPGLERTMAELAALLALACPLPD
jgi:hypothetical protein